jgi:hypothetical protein
VKHRLDQRREALVGVALFAGEALLEAFEEVLQEGVQQLLFRVEVVVKRGLRLRGLVGDALHRQVRVSVFAEGAICRPHYLLGGSVVHYTI